SKFYLFLNTNGNLILVNIIRKTNKQIQIGGLTGNSKAVSERSQVFPSSTGV
ncbi:hypothetical protein RS030_203217, partial [Cryptosporidium xiaoi]